MMISAMTAPRVVVFIELPQGASKMEHEFSILENLAFLDQTACTYGNERANLDNLGKIKVARRRAFRLGGQY